MKYFIDKIVLRNFKRIPYFFEQKQSFHIEHSNYALIGRLSTSLLHDILTPLTSLSLTSELYNQENMNQLKPVITNSTSQIQEYVGIMKDFLIDSNTTFNVHVNAEISKCITLIKHKAIEHGVQIQYLEFDQIHTQIHPLHIYQIIINLLSNAIEASTSSKDKKIILILKKEKNNFYIECKDFGIGIPPETINQLGISNFSTKSPTRGFGLYSVKHVVTKILNGELSIQSEPDNGSLFSCKLPL